MSLHKESWLAAPSATFIFAVVRGHQGTTSSLARGVVEGSKELWQLEVLIKQGVTIDCMYKYTRGK